MSERLVLNLLLGIGTTFLGVCSWLFGPLNTLFYGFLFFMFIDIFTGVGSALKNGEFTSSKMRVGLWKKAGTLTMLAVIYRIDELIPAFGHLSPSLQAWQEPMRDIFLAMFMINDVASIIENLGEWGVPLPDFLIKKLKQLKQKEESDVRV